MCVNPNVDDTTPAIRLAVPELPRIWRMNTMQCRTIVTIIMLVLWPLLVPARLSSLPARSDQVSRSGVARLDVPLMLAQDSPSCSCRPLECPNGTVEPCAANCFMSDIPDCRCAAWCDADGDPQGSNVCECR